MKILGDNLSTDQAVAIVENGGFVRRAHWHAATLVGRVETALWKGPDGHTYVVSDVGQVLHPFTDPAASFDAEPWQSVELMKAPKTDE